MKAKLLTQLKIDGKNIESGEIINVSEDQFNKWSAKGWIESIEKKEVKVKKETKELKIDSKETKDEADKD